MRVRNDGPDRVMFGLHFAEGAVVALPETLDQSKVLAITREFQVVEDEVPPAAEPVVQDAPVENAPAHDFDDTIVHRHRRRVAKR